MRKRTNIISNRKLTFLIAACFATVLVATNAFAASVGLAWDPVTASNLSGYKVHYGTQSRSYSKTLDVGKNVSYTVPSLTEGQTYYFAVTAHNTLGQSSSYSTEVSHSIPSASGTPTASDYYNTDSRSSYAVTHTWTAGGKGQLLYDATGKRLKLVTGDNIGMEIERSLLESDKGVFQIDFMPIKKYPSAGQFFLRLMEDDFTFYEIFNTDGDGPGGIEKWVDGNLVASKQFTKSYVQGSTYRLKISFSSTAVVVEGFGETVTLTAGSGSIFVKRFALELRQQDAYVDNMQYFSQADGSAPVADAGSDQTVKEGETVVLDGSGSKVASGSIKSYLWRQTAGKAVSFTTTVVKPSFTAPAITTSQEVLQFELKVTDDKGTTDTDSMTVTVMDGSAALFSDNFSIDSRSQYKVVNTLTQGGTGKLLYDAAGKRLKVVTGDNIGLEVGRALPALNSGMFRLNFLPTAKYPNGGEFKLRLLADTSTYYEIYNSDGYGAGAVRKYVAGKLAGSASFASSYVQNKSYPVSVSFSSTQVVVQAFGSTVTLKAGTTPILVNRFTLELKQQDAYIDDISY